MFQIFGRFINEYKENEQDARKVAKEYTEANKDESVLLMEVDSVYSERWERMVERTTNICRYINGYSE